MSSTSPAGPADLRLSAPAKINLWLNITGRREDGFHDLDSRFCPLELSDTIGFHRLSEGSSVTLTTTDPDLPQGPDNLAHKAARSFLEAIGSSIEHGAIHLHLEKRIPAGAGLGGGSSDAATVLLGLNQWFDRPLEHSRLHSLAADLGSDVPFFLHHQPCDISGRGEHVTPVDDSPWELPLLLIKPSFGIDTAWAYLNWQDAPEIPGIFYGGQVCLWGEMRNDLERPVFAKHLLLAEMKSWLLTCPEVHAALMSGSGSTMFAILRDPTEAAYLATRARERYGPQTWLQVTRTIGSPRR